MTRLVATSEIQYPLQMNVRLNRAIKSLIERAARTERMPPSMWARRELERAAKRRLAEGDPE